MKCNRCGFVSAGQFSQCPSCGAVQFVQPTPSPYTVKPVKQRSGGETAAIIMAVVVSSLSFIAAIIIFFSYLAFLVNKTVTSEGFDSLGEIESNGFDEDYENFFKDFTAGNDEFGLKSPAGMNTPVKFKEKLYSFSEGEVETEYEVSMTGVYRGEASLKLLYGAVLPIYNDAQYDIYLVRFSVKITDQEKDAIVTLPISNPAAYSSDSVSLFSNEFSAIDQLKYTNRFALIGTGQAVETWIAFIVDKDEKSPCIMWNRNENKAFRYAEEAISDPASVELGSAIEKEDNNESSHPTDDTVSE